MKKSKSKPQPSPRAQARTALDEVAILLAGEDHGDVQRILRETAAIPVVAECAGNLITRAATAVSQGRLRDAQRLLTKARGAVMPIANETPFELGSRVSVMRSADPAGWHDGALAATVTQRYCSASGNWSYTVVSDDEGDRYEIGHTRDLRPNQHPVPAAGPRR